MKRPAQSSTVELRPESSDRYSVTLLTPERVGVSAVCRYLGASYQDASDEAHRIGNLYGATVRDLTK